MNELDTVLLLTALDRAVERHPGMSLSIVSPKFGPLCGFVPMRSQGRKRLVVDDAKFFGPYRSVL